MCVSQTLQPSERGKPRAPCNQLRRRRGALPRPYTRFYPTKGADGQRRDSPRADRHRRAAARCGAVRLPHSRGAGHSRRRAHPRSIAPLEPRLPAERRHARHRARRPASHRSRGHARPAADRRRAARARRRFIWFIRRRAASAVCDESLRLLELQQTGRRGAERFGCRAWPLERPRVDRRARHLRDHGLEQRLAARVRPRRQALRQYIRQRP